MTGVQGQIMADRGPGGEALYGSNASLYIKCPFISLHRGKGTASAVPPKSRNSGLQPLRVCFVPAPGLSQPHSHLSSSTQRSVPQRLKPP